MWLCSHSNFFAVILLPSNRDMSHGGVANATLSLDLSVRMRHSSFRLFDADPFGRSD